jgi:hypothetical protein
MEQYKNRTEYLTVIFYLTPDPIGNRRKAIDVTGDVIYIDAVRSTADLSQVFIGIDDKDLIPCNLTSRLDIRPHFFKKIKVEWSSVNDNKTLYLIVGREASLEITPPQGVVVVAENVLPRDTYNNIRTNPVYKTRITLFNGEVYSNGVTAPIDVSDFSSMEIMVAVNDISGTLSIYIDGIFEMEDFPEFFQTKPLVYQENITTTGAWFFTITKLVFRYIRVRWNITSGGYARILIIAQVST